MPELGPAARPTTAIVALRSALASAGLDAARYGTAQWNPLGALVGPGMRVVLKPNWVMHASASGHGLDCLVTHADVIEAALQYVVKTCPRSMVVGDAPVQGCDWNALIETTRIREALARLGGAETKIELRDFRRTILSPRELGRGRRENCRGMSEFVLFDLGRSSALEPISAGHAPFRVTMYDPIALASAHGPGRHRYLIAREIVEADVVVNLPKLKTHRKAGLTGALKNLVGVNGHKEYLPHHRKGGAAGQGDCYTGRSWWRARLEDLLDATNSARSAAARSVLAPATSAALRLARWAGLAGDLEGSWHGNDTIWRTCLDLNRIVRFGRADGTLADTPQRTLIHITDAIVAGEGEGPLAPEPAALGLVTLGLSAAAADWAHARLVGLDGARVPLVREALAPHAHALCDFEPESIRCRAEGSVIDLEEAARRYGRPLRASSGWKGHCERAPRAA